MNIQSKHPPEGPLSGQDPGSHHAQRPLLSCSWFPSIQSPPGDLKSLEHLKQERPKLEELVTVAEPIGDEQEEPEKQE